MRILELAGVTKRYGRRLVLASVDLRLGARELVVVTGPNGSGKTTLLRLLATLARPSQGHVHWAATDGRPIGAPEEVRRRLGFAAHEPLVWDDLTARENLELVLRIRGSPGPGAGATAALDAWGLGRRADEPAAKLSRGLRQRLALARAFATDPPVLLLDEPTTALDADGEAILLKRVRARRGSALTVIATHQPQLFRPDADRLLEIHDLRVRDWGGPA